MSPSPLLLSADYLIRSAETSPTRDNALFIEDGLIRAIGPKDKLAAHFPQAERLHTPGGLIMPGLVNLHTHAAMALFRGLADDLPLMRWLQDYIFPVEKTLTADMVRTGTLLSCCEMIKSGTTSFCDMYLFAEAVAEATEQSGLRAWLGEAIYDFPSPCYGPVEQGIELTRKLAARYRKHSLINITAVAHAVYTCAPTLIQKMAEIADSAKIPLNIHLAENAEEIAACRERYGKSPAQHLEDLGVLGENLIAAHCVMTDEADMALMAKRQVKVAHCPQSNMKLGSGIAPVDEILAQGICVGLGTDGSASNNTVDMFAEMNVMAKIHKARRQDPLPVTAAQALHAATLGGAKALGAETVIGSLEVGKKADCIVLDMNQPHLTPMYNPISHLVYAAKGGDVLHSIVNGRLLMRDRRLLTLDEMAILQEARKLAQRIGRIVETGSTSK
ncbi:MAG: amidohydrolase [Deltaproteobacteria bacterium]|nr:amidohydrolase [Deltaproteobacteria bacterium]